MILCAQSLKDFYTEMRQEFKISFLFSSRLNQDVLENLFSKIRAIGNNPSPNSTEFLLRLRLILLGIDPSALYDRPSVEDDDSFCSDDDEFDLQRPSSDILTDCEELLKEFERNFDVNKASEQSSSSSSETAKQGFAYYTGYMASKQKKFVDGVEDKDNNNPDFN